MGFILFILTFSLTALMIHIYTMEFMFRMHNTHIGLFIPNTMDALPYLYILDEPAKCSKINGYSYFHTWTYIMLPMAKKWRKVITAFCNFWVTI